MEKIIAFFQSLTKKHLIIIAATALTLLIVIILVAAFGKSKSSADEKHSAKEPEPSKFLYGICIDTLDVEEDVVKKNQYLSTILLERNVGYPVINSLTANRKVFDARRIKVGNKYTFLLTRDSVPDAVYFIYEIDNINYAVFHLRDSVAVWKGQKEIDTVREIAYGTIESSLWNSMKDNGYDINLSIKLSEIFAWTIDFFGIQKGDAYAVIYDKMYVDTVAVGISEIYGACFKHMNSNNFAFNYNADGRGDYYDENGQNLRKAFLKAPLNYSRISSKFTNNRYHPVLKINRPHHGVDYAAPAGTPVVAIGDGVVTKKAFQKGGGGNYLYIKHNSTYTTCYMHLQGYAKGIKQGSKVKQGQVIGYVGSTGVATGPHLDFRVFKNGTPIDPLKMKSPAAKSIDSKMLDQFKADINPLKAELDSLINKTNQ